MIAPERSASRQAQSCLNSLLQPFEAAFRQDFRTLADGIGKRSAAGKYRNRPFASENEQADGSRAQDPRD